MQRPGWKNSFKAVLPVSSCSLLTVCHYGLFVDLLVEPMEMSGRKKGKNLLPVYSLPLPAATYGVWECLEVPLGDTRGARAVAVGKPLQILQKAWISSLCFS